MENKKNFGEYLKQKRKESGLTQKEFAAKLFVTESVVSKWERGVSYPDISLVKDICEIMNITERELLTASEDVQTRTNEKLAQQYVRLISRYRLIQYIIYGATLLTCFICNLAIQHTLSWFFIVLASIAVSASLTLLPTFIEKSKGIITLGAFTAALLLLLLVCNIYSGGSWFMLAAISVVFGIVVIFLPMVISNAHLAERWVNHKALICISLDTVLLFLLLVISKIYSQTEWSLLTGILLAAYWLLIPWGILLIVRYTKMSNWLKTAACIGIVDVVFFLANGFMTIMIDKRTIDLGYNFDLWNWNQQTANANIMLIGFIVLTIISIVFLVIGIKKKQKTD